MTTHIDGTTEQPSADPVDRALSRRRVLRLGAGVVGGGALLGAAAGGGMLAGWWPGGVELKKVLGLTGMDGTVPDVAPGEVRVEQVRSAARSREVTMVTMLPPGTAASTNLASTDLPVCVMLHGRGNDARGMVALGTPQFLAAAVKGGVPPFAVVAVDGGDATYWHQRSPGDGDDPQAMLREELPGWLHARQLPTPRAAMGISMGGSGALQYAIGRTRSGRDLDAVALLSPAVFRTWADARTTGGYADEADWQAHEPTLRLDQMRVGALGVWCGQEDPFCPAAREVARQARAREARFPDGEHTDGFWRRVMPDAMSLVGHTLATA
ncbi:alpha/beta hydrolase [Kitasatospora kifunensis]|uniref:Acyl-CoA:diacylglycerol acyltransferase n=1 Tax=Kitasatospora kifunensis TaxID=58351 RepID=A0A7W7VZQ9_KITKI|nr:alpha/beta hydrolase-fold protein [Kitasatospora kifunensis]MBB4928816.1 S-formylglutathione hydrolase FrmB [Kitasatospora kifunensis]